jgi:transcription elongation factor GreA
MTADSPVPSQSVSLTAEGRRLLAERVRLLEETVAQLRDALDDPEHSAESVEGHQRATRELARLQAVVRDAQIVEDIPDDPCTVELGDTVTIQLDSGATETYIVVHSAEAPVDDRRISVEAPLGAALIDRHVGDTVEVPVPGGSYRCTILTAERSAVTKSPSDLHKSVWI